MSQAHTWDWTPGEKTIASLECPSGFRRQEEFQVSPDGEKIAAVACRDDETFTVRVNNGYWDGAYEKLWHLRFSPDGRLTALAQMDGRWFFMQDGQAVGEGHDFLWSVLFDKHGSHTACAVQDGMRYAMLSAGVPWKQFFENANNFALSPEGGRTAAVVQVKGMGSADTDTFSNGIFTLAVDGETWEETFVNVWTPVFSAHGTHVAAQVRTSPRDYTIAVDGKTWSRRFQCVWAPYFDPAGGDVLAPVRIKGKWGLARNGHLEWAPILTQCWKVTTSQDGKNVYAVGSAEYGQFTVIHNGRTWKSRFPVVMDIRLSPDGTRAACLGNHTNTEFVICVDDTPWPGYWGTAWPPVFSPCGRHVGAAVRRNGNHTVVVNAKGMDRVFARCWSPVFSPDGEFVLVRALEGRTYKRMVLPVEHFA